MDGSFVDLILSDLCKSLIMWAVIIFVIGFAVGVLVLWVLA